MMSLFKNVLYASLCRSIFGRFAGAAEIGMCEK